MTRLEKLQREPSLGIMEAQLRPPLDPYEHHSTMAVGFKGAPESDSHHTHTENFFEIL